MIDHFTQTLIPRLGSCWCYNETVIRNSNPLAAIEVHYMEKNPKTTYSSKKYFFDWRKKDMSVLDYMGVSKLSENV